MNYKPLALGVLSVASVGVLAFFATGVEAYRGDYTQVGPNYTEERHTQMEEIMDSKDYEAWKELMTEDGRTPGVLNKVDSQEKFELFVEAKELAEEGDIEGSQEIRESLGLGQGQGQGGRMHGNGDGSCNR